jgi:hypothetical protein
MTVLDSPEAQGQESPGGPWIMFPLDVGNSIDVGDGMTCIVCNTAQVVTGIYAELPAMDKDRKLIPP